MRSPWPLPLAALLGCAGGRFEGNVYRDRQVAFEVGSLGPAWQTASLAGADVLFRHPAGGAVMANATCPGPRDASLEVLANQALFGISEAREWSRELRTLDGRAALELRLAGALDGVPVGLDLVVLRKDGCVYDLELVAGRPVFQACDRDFERLVAGFRTLPSGG